MVVFSQDCVYSLTDQDFDCNQHGKISIKDDRFMLVLFHNFDEESINLATLYALTACQIAGPVFAAINVEQYPKVDKAIQEVLRNGEHPYHRFVNEEYPFLLVYRNGVPKAMYNGGKSVASLEEYALVQSCQGNR